MNPSIARQIAQYSHVRQVDRLGQARIEHVERVAAHVPADARVAAFLHDVLEHTGTGLAELRENGLTDVEERTLALLTRHPEETFEAHALRVACGTGPEGHIARVVRLAALDDHLAQRRLPDDAPPYAWARRRIAVAHDVRLGDAGAA